jgi:hypothetical protein
MPARLPFPILARLWAALLVVAIALHAAMPSSAPSFERAHGSAFAANTHEVALFAQRADRVARQAPVPVPLTPAAPAAEPRPAHRIALPNLSAPRPDSTGPPLHELGAWRPAPRAPPSA